MEAKLESSSKVTVRQYLDAINNGGWESYIADDMNFTTFSLAKPKQAQGRDVYIRILSM